MKIRDIMTKGIELVTPDTVLQEAAQKMKNLNIGAVPVCDGWKLVGMLTDRDITIRATAEGRDPKATRVGDVMTKDVAYCFEDEDLSSVERLMEERQVRRVPIVDREQRLVGIISLGDLAVDMHDERRSGEVLERVSEPSRPKR